MPLSTDVRLPRDLEPVFPDRCCVCGKPRPGDAILVARRTGFLWWDLLMPWLILARDPERRAAPACRPCRIRAVRYRRTQRLVLCLVAVAAGVVVVPWVSSWGWSGGQSKLVGLLLVGAVVAPVIVCHAVWPRAFDLTVERRVIVYEFASAEYGEAFRAANPRTES